MNPELLPTRKVTATGIGGAVSVILVWALGLLGLDVPAEVAAAFATLGALVASYATRERE